MIMAKVRGRELEAHSDEPLTCGSVGLPLHFVFDAAWAGLNKLAVFRCGERSADLLLEGDACSVPQALLQVPERALFLGVRGTDSRGETVIPTVWCRVGYTVRGAEASGLAPEEFTPSLAEQVLQRAEEAVAIAQSVRDDADAGEFDGAPIVFLTQAEYDALSEEEKAADTYWITDDQPTEPRGLAPGGTAGQLLTKHSGEDFDTLWTSPASPLPAVSAADDGKLLRVVNGAWAAVSLPAANGGSF